jgi:hypothetical protein
MHFHNIIISGWNYTNPIPVINIIVVDTPAAHTGPHDTTHDGALTCWPNIVLPSDSVSACRAEQPRVYWNLLHALRFTMDPRRCGAHRPLVRQYKYATYIGWKHFKLGSS